MNFDNAKRLYHNKLRPMLKEQHEVHLEHDLTHAHTNPELAQRAALHNDDRLLKTLLLAALVPEVETLKDALEHLLGQALAHEFPAHPEFEREVRPADLRKVFEIARQAAGTEDGRVLVEIRALRPIVRQIANPLRLGSMSETHFVLSHEWRNHFNRQLAAVNKVTPTGGSCAPGSTSHSRVACQRT